MRIRFLFLTGLLVLAQACLPLPETTPPKVDPPPAQIQAQAPNPEPRTRDTLYVATDALTGRPLDSFFIDALGQVYRWAPSGAITKFSAASEVLSGVAPELRYQNARLGRLAQVDLTNALRPVLFYREAQTVVYLDRNLAELRQLRLVEFDIGQVDAVAYARNDALWLYSADRQQLLLLDRQNRVIQESPVFSQLFGTPIRVVEMVATAQQVTLATEDGRLLLFGPFGSFRTQVLRPGRFLIADEERLLFFESGRWSAVDRELGFVREIDIGSTSRSLLMIRGERTLWHAAGRIWQEAP